MAGINLAGAIGMTGKRESIFADLPEIVQHTGDNIAKNIAAQKEKRERQASLLQKQKLEESQKAYDEAGNIVTVNASHLTVPDFQDRYHEYVLPKAKQFMAIQTDPRISTRDKELAKIQFKDDVQQASKFYQDAEKAYGEVADDKEGLYNFNKVKNIFGGVESVQETPNVQENIPNDLAHAPNSMNQNNIVSTPQDSRTVQEEIGRTLPLHKMPYEQAIQKFKDKLPTDVVKENTYLTKYGVGDVINSVSDIKNADAWVKQTTKNGSDLQFGIDEAEKAKNKRNFIYAIVSGRNKESKGLAEGIKAQLYHDSRRDLMHLTPDERSDYIEKGVEKIAGEWFDNWAATKEKELVNDPKYRTEKLSKGKEGVEIASTPIAKTPQEEGIIIDYNSNKKSKESKQEDLDRYKKILKLGKHTRAGGVEENLTPEQRKYYEGKVAEIEGEGKVVVVGRPDFSAMNTAQVKLKKDGQPIYGTPVSPIITKNGDLMMEVQEKVTLPYGEGEETRTHVVPLDVDNEQILINNAGDNKGLLRKQIENAKKESELIKQKSGKQPEKSVSSQGSKQVKNYEQSIKAKVKKPFSSYQVSKDGKKAKVKYSDGTEEIITF